MVIPNSNASSLQQAAYQLAACTDQLFQRIEQEQILESIIDRIRSSLELEDIFRSTSTSIRQLLNADRVGVFRFEPESGWDNGEFVSEDVGEAWPSAVAAKVHDHCFGERFSVAFSQGRVQALADVYKADLSDCYIDLLERFQVRANLVVPVLKGGDLWGLLCIHQCDRPRHWQAAEIEFVQKIAAHFSLALQQAENLEQIKSQAALLAQTTAQEKALLRQKALVKIVSKIRQSFELSEICQTACNETRQLLGADRVTIYHFNHDWSGEFLFESLAENWTPLVGVSPAIEDTHLMETQGGRYAENETYAIADIYTAGHTDCHVALLQSFQARAYAIAPIFQGDRLWGLLAAFQNSAPRTWQTDEVELLAQVGAQIGIAWQQAEFVRQIQSQSTDLKHLLEELQQSQLQLQLINQDLARATRLKDEFLANMSHELRTPLNAILGMTESLQEGVFGPVSAQQAKPIKTINRSGAHLLELIDDILDLAKIESGQVELKHAFVAVEHLCGSSLAFVKQQALKKNIQLHQEIASGLPDIRLDERRIRQVLINLLNNAVKFTQPGGCVTLNAALLPVDGDELSRADLNLSPLRANRGSAGKVSSLPRLRLSVTDTGIGITPKNLKKLFQPFIQIDSALNRQYDGTGLGLALVKRIVDLHKGQVAVNSKLGKGSCFVVELPYTMASWTAAKAHKKANNLIGSAAPMTTAVANSEPSADAQAPLILVAEDNPANVSTLSSYLEAKGYRICVAENGQTAIDLAQAQRPNLILMDIQMPVMDGLTAMKCIRQLPHGAATPMIALSALAMDGDRERCLEAGANSYFSKPVKLKALVLSIQRLLTAQSKAAPADT